MEKQKDETYKDIDHVNTFICQNHDDIKFLCLDILKLDCGHEIRNLVNIILDRSKQAKYQGVKMEKRLSKYRKSIEKLGYIRVDSNKL